MRLPGVDVRPLRAILDSRLGLPLSSRLCATAGEFATLAIATRAASQEREAALTAKGIEVARVEADSSGHVDLVEALRLMARRGLTRVFSEGGPRVGARLIASRLADEVVLLTATKPLGRRGVPALDAPAYGVLNDPARYREIEAAAYGADASLGSRAAELTPGEFREGSTMFTGIVSDVGEVLAIEEAGELRRFRLACRYETASVAVGASIAHAGVCLTVVDVAPLGDRTKHRRRRRRGDAGGDDAGGWRPGTKSISNARCG